MSGKRGGLSDAVARFTAEVSDAVTNARRTAAAAREQSAKFRSDTEELRAKPTSPARPPAEEPPPPPPEDEDFSQHRLLDDGAPPAPQKSAEDSPAESAEPVETMADSATDTSPEDPHTSDDEDFSQQRILVDATPESYRPEALGVFEFDLPDLEKPS
jgi:hypothetical protein